MASSLPHVTTFADIAVPFIAACACYVYQARKEYDPGPTDMMCKLLRKIVPCVAVLCCARFPQVIRSSFWDYDVNGAWMERNDLIPVAVMIFRAEHMYSLIERLTRLQSATPLSPMAIWGIVRRTALVVLWFRASRILVNIALPATVLDEMVSLAVNDVLTDTILMGKVPEVISALFDWVPFLPFFVKYVQVAGACLREGDTISGLCGVICVLHNAHALYAAMFDDFIDRLITINPKGALNGPRESSNWTAE
eukprot:GEMP01032466.1.p1 GENE.GEMP01032466.1~~GEMP01032466.1.p1  ORF type:complete len:252 (+),score=58.04 GEMP01032466.1:293-1048(+)